MNNESVSRWLEWTTYNEIFDNGLDSLIVVGIALAGNFLLQRFIASFCGLLKHRRPDHPPHLKKIDTLHSLLGSSARYSIAFLTVLRILAIRGVPASSLAIGSAILASAVGFGSQGLVQDMITGIPLLFEEQLRVGDYVEINAKQGTVREVGLRVVKIEELNGTIHTIFNRNITMVTTLAKPEAGS